MQEELNINKRILLGISGGIAAYKSAELVRLLRKQGAEVRVVMTASAMAFITPLTFEALTGQTVHRSLFSAEDSAMAHIDLARWADLMLIAPATANCIAKFAHGLADDLLSTLYLAANCPVYVAPAMNQAMWGKAVTQENIQKLKAEGVVIIGPEAGEQACGEMGYGRMSEPTAICAQLFSEWAAVGCLQGVNVLISAGPTREPLDPVRFISNRSSGKMGYALAEAAVRAGAHVTLVTGPVSLAKPAHVNTISVETAAEMYTAMMAQAPKHDIYIGAAAVADYAPAIVKANKIKKQSEQTTIILHKTKDILAEVASLSPRPFTVGFAAETHDLETYAQTKLVQKNVDMIAANWVGQAQGGFDSEQNAVHVFWKSGQQEIPMMDKKQLAHQLISIIAREFDKYNATQRI